RVLLSVVIRTRSDGACCRVARFLPLRRTGALELARDILPEPAIWVGPVVYDDGIWLSLTNCFGGEPEFGTHPCEKKDHSLFIGRRVGQPGIVYFLPDMVSRLGG